MSTDGPATDETGDPGATREAQFMVAAQAAGYRRGSRGATEMLGVNYRTFNRCLESGKLARRVKEAVKKLPEA